MAQPQPAAHKDPRKTGDVVSELWTLLKDYGRQETIDPLKDLGRFIAFGSGATLCWGIAGTLYAIAIMRFIQVEGRRWFSGNWSWVAYLVALAVTSGAAFVSLKQIKKGRPS